LVQSLKFKGFTASKAHDSAGRCFIHLQKMTEPEKAIGGAVEEGPQRQSQGSTGSK
jgi:hypothetical protein